MSRLLSSAGLVPALLVACLQSAQVSAAELMFLDGGYAELCSIAAQQANKPYPTQRYEVTGSRMSLSPMEVCGRAVNGYDGAADNVAESYNNRGVLWFAQGDHAAAARDFERAIAQQGSMAQAHVNLGYTLIAMQRWTDAISAFTRGIELGTVELARAHFNRGIAHEETGALREAYVDYQQAALLEPEWDLPKEELSRFQVILR